MIDLSFIGALKLIQSDQLSLSSYAVNIRSALSYLCCELPGDLSSDQHVSVHKNLISSRSQTDSLFLRYHETLGMFWRQSMHPTRVSAWPCQAGCGVSKYSFWMILQKRNSQCEVTIFARLNSFVTGSGLRAPAKNEIKISLCRNKSSRLNECLETILIR